ncbi:serine hydrolase [Janthinobacterium sp. SUN118]|uniref:serine hydrolase domain-containing protein n=1 Tax=Janthinobacterium sp. SUN118 TaxID=3004100 RepID=UPI0025AF831F|nr:serine hydrolase domain-containing protein [Janthinobacterium sp. SUN118]MDN2708139.1 serine hydrolase [Janthinobacterium sp. SUN118]
MKALCYLAIVSPLLALQPPVWGKPPAASATQAATRAQQVDALFAKWNRADTPGAAVMVVKDGQRVYRGSFGMADIEQNRPITPSTSFHVASLSKQFTAFAILLLAQDGKLSLDDDVRKHVPALPDFGQTIRIRHLLTHTSGLRDQWNLLAMAGWRMDDVITDDDVLRLVRRQRALNFVPGSDFAYNNTGYTLLAAIVRKVSGQPLAAFARERIFDPLGMRHTFFHEQYATLVAGRAQSYQPAPQGGYSRIALSYSTVGPTSLVTTADDLLLWANNFNDARVGGPALLARMQTSATFNDGKATGYGGGLDIGAYRGLKTIDHSGADAGFRSYLVRFPDQQLTVVIMGNGADVQASRLGQRIADIYLDGQLQPLPKPMPNYSDGVQVPLAPARLDALLGTYALENGSAITFAREDEQLLGWTAGDDKMPFYPAGEREFFVKLSNASFRFDAPDAAGVIGGGTWLRNARAIRAKRMAPARLPDAALQPLLGEYYSDELHALYTVTAQEGSVVLGFSRGDIALAPFGKNSFVGPWPFGLVTFQCLAASDCTGFTVTESRASDVQFTRVALPGLRGSTATP